MAKRTINKEKKYQEMIDVIGKGNIFNNTELANSIGVSRNWLYMHGFHEDEYIQNLIDKNRYKMTKFIQKEFLKNASPACLIAMYKLVCTREERMILADKFEDEDSCGSEKTINYNFNVISTPKDGRETKDDSE